MQTIQMTSFFSLTTPAQAESPPYSTGAGSKRLYELYVNSDKTEFVCFNQDNAISFSNDRPLKLISLFIYISSKITSTKSDINIKIGKA